MCQKNFELQNKKGQKHMEVLNKSMIEKWIVPYLSKGKRGATGQVALEDVVAAILHRLKAGDQWRQLLLKQFLSRVRPPATGCIIILINGLRMAPFKKHGLLFCNSINTI